MLLKTLTYHVKLPKWQTVKVIQMVPGLSYGDAISNDVISLQKYLTEKGYNTGIYSPKIDNRLINSGVYYLPDMPVMQNEDILLYHYSQCPKPMEQILRNSNCRKIMIYHNITPGTFYQEYHPEFAKMLGDRRTKLRTLTDVFDCCLADSEYNKSDLCREGYTCPIKVLPIVISFEDYKSMPDDTILKKYSQDGFTNVLFVGRIVPNKKIEDIIRAFSYYHIHINSKSRLFIVGSDAMGGTYASWLKSLVKESKVMDHVLFTGHVSFAEILSYYLLADVFLCMSEHEGFCVPLIEAMIFSVPIIAYGSTAVPETVRDAGIIVKTKDPAEIANQLNRVVTDERLRKSLHELMQRRLKDFSWQNTTVKFERYLESIMKGEL